MPTFNAGEIEGKAVLSRDEFIAGLDEISAKADEFSKKKISPKIDLTGIKQARTQFDQIAAAADKLSKKKISPKIDMSGISKSAAQLDKVSAAADKLGKKKITPKVDLTGITKAQAQIKALQLQSDKLGRSSASPSVKIDTKDSAQGLSRLLDAILALAPALAPVGAAALGGAAGLAGAFTAAGAGVGVFALAAIPAIKKVAAAEGSLQTAVQSRTAAQKTALDGLSTSELAAARKLQGLVQTYNGFSQALEPTTFTVLAKGAGIASDALHDIAPVAHTTGQALVGLEDKAKTALDTKFYKTFFNYLAVEAPRSVGTLGRSLGNVGTGFAGLLEDFTPVEHQLEGGLLRLTQKFADFGKTGATNTGLQNFIAYVEKEGPQAVHLIGQFGSTFATVAKDAAPLGAVELKIVSGLLKFIDAEAKAHPKLIELALGVYTVNKAVSALKLTAVIGSATKLAGVGVGLGSVAVGSKTISQVFPKVAKVTDAVATASYGAQFKMLQLGDALGGSEAAGLAFASSAAAVVGGLVAVQAIFSRGKLSVDQQTAAIIANDKATGNNLAGYKKALTDLSGLQDKYAKSRNKALLTAGGASDPTGKGFALQAGNAKQAQDAFDKLSKADKNVIQGASGIQKQFATLGPQYKLTTKQALGLANTLGINLSKGWKGNSQAAQDNRAKMAEYVAEVKLSHDPTATFKADLDQAGNAALTATQQQQGFNAAIQQYQDLTSATITSAAQAGDALKALSGDFKKGTSDVSKNAAAATLLSGNLAAIASSGPQTRKFAEDLGSLQTGYDNTYNSIVKYDTENHRSGQVMGDVSKASVTFRAQMVKQLEQMGLNATQAQKLADKYAGVPKYITTKAHLEGVKQVEADAAGMKKKILDIPLGHTTTTKADVAAAEKNIATLKTRIQGLPPKAKVTAEANVTAAEQAIDTLESHIYALTNKTWRVTLKTDGSVLVPSLAHGPVATNATGGPISGPGGPRDDKVLMWGSNGEFMQQASAVQREGVPAMQALNDGKATIVRRAAGGLIDITAVTNAASLVPSVDSFASQLGSAQTYAKSQAALAASAGSGNGGALQAYAKSLLGKFGWAASQMAPLIKLWNKESGWNPNAQNPTSSAYGVAQFLDSTWGSFTYPKTSDGRKQVYDGLEYIGGDYGSPAAAWAHEVANNWYGDGLVGGIFTKPTLIGVGEKGPERVDVTPIPGYASGGAVKKPAPAKIPGTSFTSPKLFEQAGSHLLDVILGSLTGNRARSAIQQVDNSIIHSIDADFTGSTQSGLVKYTQKVNSQMLGLATERDRIAQRLSAANELSTTVTAAAKSSADISSFTALGAKNLQKEFNSQLAAINRFADNIELMKRHGFSSELISELLNAGIDQSAPIAAQLAKAKPAAVHKFNATQKAVDRASKRLGTVAVNAEFGKSAADNFVARLRSQEHSLETQMAQLAKVFAHGVGHAFHIKGYASGGHATGLAVVGERGPELADFGNPGAAIHPNLRVGGSGDTSKVEALLGVLIDAVNAGHVIKVNEKVLGRVVTQRQKVDAVRGVR